MSNKKYLVVKLGSQTITNADGNLDIPQLEALLSQIIELKKQGYYVLLVSSGAVATGRGSTQNMPLKFQSIVEERQLLASIGQAKLIEIYNSILKSKGYIAAQVLLTKEDFRKRSHYLNTYNLFHGLIKNDHVLPVINENDVTSINELMFTDNDELSAQIAIQMHVKHLIILTSVDGVYDQNPIHPEAKIIPTLDLNEEENWPNVFSGKTLYGRGGMLSKLSSARKAAHFGIQIHIANARVPQVLTRILNKESVGTTILPYKQHRGIKRWLANTHPYALPSVKINVQLGEIFLKKEKAISLLPVGIVSMEGEFEKGDLVAIKDSSSQTIGLGIAAYSSVTLSSIVGEKGQKFFIHYNKIYIFDRR